MAKGCTIKSVKGRSIKNSFGKQTVEVELRTDCGVFNASVPHGTSVGRYEKHYVPIENALDNVKKIEKKLIKKDCTRQKDIDRLLVMENAGANTSLAISMALCRAGAAASGLPLYRYIARIAGNRNLIMPHLQIVVIAGGKHATNRLSFQEFMLCCRENSVAKSLAVGKKAFNSVKKLINKNYDSLGKELEGGFSPRMQRVEEAFYIIKESIKGGNTAIAIDVAASSIFWKGNYILDKRVTEAKGLLDYYDYLVKSYPLVSIEDPFAQDDWQNWIKLNNLLDKNVQVVGDDLTVTNTRRIREAIRRGACNAIILKPNQIGTVSETIEAWSVAKRGGLSCVVSHRAGETMDDFIADLTVGIGTGQIKAGAPFPKERKAKYDRLLKIEKELRKS